MKREKDINKWSEIDYTYMTEESSGEDNSVNIHQLPWRSEGLIIASYVAGMDLCLNWNIKLNQTLSSMRKCIRKVEYDGLS